MKKLLALMLCGIMLLVPMASFAEAGAEDTELSAFSIAVSDLVINYNGMELDFTGLTDTDAIVTGEDGSVLLNNTMTVGGETALELNALVEGTQLTVVLFDKNGNPVEPALSVDIAPYLEQVQQQMTGTGDMEAMMQEAMQAVQEAMAGLQVSEPYTAEVTYPDGTAVNMNLMDYVLPEEQATALLGKILTMVGQEVENVPALTGAVTMGSSEDGMKVYYELAISSQGQVLDVMLFGTYEEAGITFDLLAKFEDQVLAQGGLEVVRSEKGAELYLALSTDQVALNVSLTLEPGETGYAGAVSLQAVQAAQDEETPATEISVSFNYEVAQAAFSSLAYSVAAEVLKAIPAVTPEQLSQAGDEAIEQAVAAWTAAALEGVEVMRTVPAVELLYSYATMVMGYVNNSEAEAAQ